MMDTEEQRWLERWGRGWKKGIDKEKEIGSVWGMGEDTDEDEKY